MNRRIDEGRTQLGGDIRQRRAPSATPLADGEKMKPVTFIAAKLLETSSQFLQVEWEEEKLQKCAPIQNCPSPLTRFFISL